MAGISRTKGKQRGGIKEGKEMESVSLPGSCIAYINLALGISCGERTNVLLDVERFEISIHKFILPKVCSLR